jgi:hypothetical protein
LVLLTGEGEEEIGWEALGITLDLLIQALNRNTIEVSEICVEDDFLIA